MSINLIPKYTKSTPNSIVSYFNHLTSYAFLFMKKINLFRRLHSETEKMFVIVLSKKISIQIFFSSFFFFLVTVSNKLSVYCNWEKNNFNPFFLLKFWNVSFCLRPVDKYFIFFCVKGLMLNCLNFWKGKHLLFGCL